jgi:hypothetical protein
MSDVFFEVLSPLPLDTRKDARRLFKLWQDCAPGFLPDRWGLYEPLRKGFSLATLEVAIEVWEHMFLMKRVAAPKLESTVFMQYGPHRQHSGWEISLRRLRDFDQASFCKLLRSAAAEFRADFGLLHSVLNLEIERGRAGGAVGFLDSKRTQKHLFVTTHDLKKYLPDIYWCTVFGVPYVQLLTREKLFSAPVHRVEELENGLIMLQLTPTLVEAVENEAAFEARRKDVKAHLEGDGLVFFDPEKGADFAYRVPEFKWAPILN